MKIRKLLILLPALLILSAFSARAQIERQRADVGDTIDDAFWAPALITQPTTEHIDAGNLNVTIMHSFGLATTNVVQNLFGLDNVQNVRLGLDFGLTNRWTVGIGRSSLSNVVDLRTKYALLRQNSAGSIPVSISLKGDLGIITQENSRPFTDDMSILISAIISRRVTEQLSLQLSPMYGHFNRAFAGQQNNLWSLGVGGEVHLSQRFALIGEYYPVIGDRSAGTSNAFSLGLNINTGGHVFQLFLTSTQWHLEQFVLANNNNQFWAGDFRFGFNVNRIFGL